MSKRRDTLLTLALLALVFSGPAALAAYLVSGDQTTEPVMLAAVSDTGAAPPAASVPGTRGGQAGMPVLMGVLYTRGTALVDWGGVKIPIEDGSYAYLGGEVISTGPGSMGVLQLDSDNSAYMCPGSKMSLTRADGGTYQIKIFEGAGRFAFAPGTDFRIEANQGVFSPSSDGAGSAEPTVVEIAVFQRHPGGVACGFSSRLDVAGYPADGGGTPIALGNAGPGEIIDLSRALSDESATRGTPVIMQPIQMPAGVRDWLQSNAPYPPDPGPIGYLCRCLELKRYAEADGIPDAAIAPRMLPPDSKALARVDSDTGPPELPPVVLAVPGAPDAADPGVLSVPTATRLTVPPPLIPATGSGGGFASTPS